MLPSSLVILIFKMRWFIGAAVLVAVASAVDARLGRRERSISFEEHLGTVEADTTPLELHVDVGDVKARNETAPWGFLKLLQENWSLTMTGIFTASCLRTSIILVMEESTLS